VINMKQSTAMKVGAALFGSISVIIGFSLNIVSADAWHTWFDACGTANTLAAGLCAVSWLLAQVLFMSTPGIAIGAIIGILPYKLKKHDVYKPNLKNTTHNKLYHKIERLYVYKSRDAQDLLLSMGIIVSLTIFTVCAFYFSAPTTHIICVKTRAFAGWPALLIGGLFFYVYIAIGTKCLAAFRHKTAALFDNYVFQYIYHHPLAYPKMAYDNIYANLRGTPQLFDHTQEALCNYLKHILPESWSTTLAVFSLSRTDLNSWDCEEQNTPKALIEFLDAENNKYHIEIDTQDDYKRTTIAHIPTEVNETTHYRIKCLTKEHVPTDNMQVFLFTRDIGFDQILSYLLDHKDLWKVNI